jgi:hypothetical protein
MYNNQNGIATGAKWYFWLVIVILVGTFALGFNIKDAKWLNGKIASETAKQMSVETDVERQKADLDLQLLKTQTEIQIAQQKQQAEYEAAKQQQELNALTLANTQKADFRNGLYNTLNIGLMALMIVFSIVLSALGINASFGLRKALSVKAETSQPNTIYTAVSLENRRKPSIAAQQARKREQLDRQKKIRAERVNQLFKNSEAIWSADDGKLEEFVPGNDPLAN